LGPRDGGKQKSLTPTATGTPVRAARRLTGFVLYGYHYKTVRKNRVAGRWEG